MSLKSRYECIYWWISSSITVGNSWSKMCRYKYTLGPFLLCPSIDHSGRPVRMERSPVRMKSLCFIWISKFIVGDTAQPETIIVFGIKLEAWDHIVVTKESLAWDHILWEGPSCPLEGQQRVPNPTGLPRPTKQPLVAFVWFQTQSFLSLSLLGKISYGVWISLA